MAVAIHPSPRVIGGVAVAAALLIGAFGCGATRGSASTGGPAQSGSQAGARLTAASAGARITVTGTGMVTGTPNQLTLAMGVQVNGPSVDSALQQANQAVSRVTAALRAGGVAASDIQTSGLSIQPNYGPNSQVPVGYGASESLTATLVHLATAGAQIEAAVHAGGNATAVNYISLNLSDTSGLLGTARARAIGDAHAKAAQYARALGQPLGPVVSVSDQAQAFPPPVYAAVPSAAAGRASSVPISPGSQQLSVSVTVVYALA
jgi:uncharacterized protein YggE